MFLFLSASLSAFLSVCLCVSSLFLSAFMTHRESVQPSVVLSTCVPFISAHPRFSESHLKRLQTPEFPFPFVTCNCQNVPRNDVERREEREQTEESDEHVAGGYEPGFGHPDDGFTRSSRELPRFPFWLRRENIKFNFFLS